MIVAPRPNESSVVCFNGECLVISFARNGHAPEYLEIRRHCDNSLVKRTSWSGIFGCALVIAGQIHLWGATGGTQNGNSIIHCVLDQNLEPSGQDVVFQADSANGRVANSSVCFDGQKYVMAIETTYLGIVFFQSLSPSGPWTRVPGVFNVVNGVTFYAACPSIKFCDGWYYVFYLKGVNSSGQQDTVVARSQTLLPGSWQVSANTVLTPLPTEGINNSDLDFAEVDGKVYGVYFDGDQSTWLNTRTCFFDGSMRDFLACFF